MAQTTNKLVIPDEIISSKIYLIRDKKVMLDEDLAELYGVTTGNLNKAVNRNIARFPEDFMFLLTKEEFNNLIFQFGTSSWGGRRKPPYAFTELCQPLHKQNMVFLCWHFTDRLNSEIQKSEMGLNGE